MIYYFFLQWQPLDRHCFITAVPCMNTMVADTEVDLHQQLACTEISSYEVLAAEIWKVLLLLILTPRFQSFVFHYNALSSKELFRSYLLVCLLKYTSAELQIKCPILLPKITLPFKTQFFIPLEQYNIKIF